MYTGEQPKASELKAQAKRVHATHIIYTMREAGFGNMKQGFTGTFDQLDAYLAKVGSQWSTPAVRDVIWRSRAAKTPELLAKMLMSGGPAALATGAMSPRAPTAGSTAAAPAAKRRNRLGLWPAARCSPGPFRVDRIRVDNMVEISLGLC